MENKAVWSIAVMGVLAAAALTAFMMFSLHEIADTQTPKIAEDVSQTLTRGLRAAPPANVRLSMHRVGQGIDAPRVYKLVLRPSDAVAADEKALSRLMFRASERCASQIGGVKCDVTIRCVAELPQGGTTEASFTKDKSSDPGGTELIHAVAAVEPKPDEDAPR